MKKFTKNGEVAVLYSVGYGSGWYSSHGIEELLYDPKIVQMILNSGEKVVGDEHPVSDEILDYCKEKYGYHWYGGVDGLTIMWVPKGTEFLIHEYDGAERVALKKEYVFLTA